MMQVDATTTFVCVIPILMGLRCLVHGVQSRMRCGAWLRSVLSASVRAVSVEPVRQPLPIRVTRVVPMRYASSGIHPTAAPSRGRPRRVDDTVRR